MTVTSLTRNQYAAMRKSREIGLQLQLNSPEIAEDFRRGIPFWSDRLDGREGRIFRRDY